MRSVAAPLRRRRHSFPVGWTALAALDCIARCRGSLARTLQDGRPSGELGFF